MLLWLFPVIFAYLYGLIGGVEFMLPLFGVIDSSETTQQTIARWFSPAWEVTNVFFVAAITSFAAIFPLVLPAMPNNLRLWLLISGACLALRAILVLTFFYARSGKGRTILTVLALVSLTLPAVLSQAVLAIISPDASLPQSIGAALIGVALALALCCGLFYALNETHRRYKLCAQICWAATAAGFLLMGSGDHSLVTLGVVVGCAALGAILISAISRARWAVLGLSAALYSVLAVELAIRQWPWVIFDKLSYSTVQAPPSIQAVIAWGSLVGLLFIGPPLVWLGTVVVRQHRGKIY
jgi:cytochrome bd-type quinol oxidase subunit 2